MSLAGDILKAAAAKQAALHDQHLAEMKGRSDALTDVIKRPWEARVAAIVAAVRMTKRLVAGDDGAAQPDDKPASPIGFHAPREEPAP
jgi:hypothetical protein